MTQHSDHGFCAALGQLLFLSVILPALARVQSSFSLPLGTTIEPVQQINFRLLAAFDFGLQGSIHPSQGYSFEQLHNIVDAQFTDAISQSASLQNLLVMNNWRLSVPALLVERRDHWRI